MTEKKRESLFDIFETEEGKKEFQKQISQQKKKEKEEASNEDSRKKE